MAGKTKKQGSRPSTPGTPKKVLDGPKGHLGLKSSPYCVTDAKLMSQYMVQDHMAAHYKKVTTAKACVDSGPPKAWLISQKVRDRVRRDALKAQVDRRDQWLAKNEDRNELTVPARPPSVASSDADRNELYAMLENLNDDYDNIDGRVANTTMEVNVSDSPLNRTNHGSNLHQTASDLQLVDKIIGDNENSPSHYHNPKLIQSNIPARGFSATHNVRPNSARRANQGPNQAGVTVNLSNQCGATQTVRGPATPRNKKSDLVDTHAHRFTEEKPFQPRTLKTNRTSKLSEFKYYNPPKTVRNRPELERSVSAPPVPPARASQGTPQMHVRSGTPLTGYTGDSMETLMLNETLMSRDSHQMKTPTGVPPLDISLDKDHMNWLKEQSVKAHVRAGSGRTGGTGHNSRVGDMQKPGTMGSTQNGGMLTQMINGRTLNGTRDAGTGVRSRAISGNSFPSETFLRVSQEEEELKYLEFITEVTNDVLDRGIFTNRVLKQVFQSHIDRRRHDLKLSRMREMLAELQRDLGIPSSDIDDDSGLASTRELDSFGVGNENNVAINTTNTISPQRMSPQKRDISPNSRPPLPRPSSSTRTRSRGGSLSRENSQEENDSGQKLGKTLRKQGAIEDLRVSFDEGTKSGDDEDMDDVDGGGLGLSFGKTLRRDDSMDELKKALTETLNQNSNNHDGNDVDDVHSERDDGQDTEQASVYTDTARSQKQDDTMSSRRSSRHSDTPRTVCDSTARSERDTYWDDYDEDEESGRDTPKAPPTPTRRKRSSMSGQSTDRSSRVASSRRSTDHESESIEVSELEDDEF